MRQESATSLPRLTALLALLVAWVVTLSLPATYFALGYQALSAAVQTKVDIKAETMNQLIATQPEVWRYSEHRLRELLARYPLLREDEQVTAYDEADAELAAIGEAVPSPSLLFTSTLFDAGSVVGRIEIHRSISPLLLRTAVAWPRSSRTSSS